MDITDIEKIVSEKGRLIDKEIEKAFPRNGVPNLHDAVHYHLESGGKRIRPALAILTCEALGGDAKKIMPFAAACEVLHNWFLIHDDIEDSDRVRRNKPAVWVKYGLAHGVNIGDYMAHKVFELILSSDLPHETILALVRAEAETAIRTGEGQAMDMNMRSSRTPTEKEYLDVIMAKTGHYLTMPMVGGAIIAGHEEIIPRLIEYGRNIGPAFQITDDVLDLTKGKGRKETGRDIKEGKRSILVVHCLGKCTRQEKERLIRILNKPPEKTSAAEVKYARSLFEKHNSIEYAISRAEEFSQTAKNVARTMPPKLRDILLFMCDYVMQRDN